MSECIDQAKGMTLTLLAVRPYTHTQTHTYTHTRTQIYITMYTYSHIYIQVTSERVDQAKGILTRTLTLLSVRPSHTVAGIISQKMALPLIYSKFSCKLIFGGKKQMPLVAMQKRRGRQHWMTSRRAGADTI